LRLTPNDKFLESARRLLRPGQRVGVAVSGGADSVALLHLLLGARAELGLVLAVVHFNHRIRGPEADADETFVRALAERYELEWLTDSADTPAYAASHKVSLETAARQLRYHFFAQLASGTPTRVDKIATAHTMDDQAETVLMRLLRGAGTRGLAGIYPEQAENHMVRPLLDFRRSEIEGYLRDLQQEWRHDKTNLDLHHTRNRIRHELLPQLVRDYNPAVVEALARTAEGARAEEEYWAAEVQRLLPFVLLEGKPVRGGGRATAAVDKEYGLSLEALRSQPLALQRRLVRAAAERLRLDLDAEHVESALEVIHGTRRAAELPEGWRLEPRFRELRFVRSEKKLRRGNYSYLLTIPGKATIHEVGSVIHATTEDLVAGTERDTLVSNSIVITVRELRVRNWQPGDRFQPSHAGSERKVKDLLETLRLSPEERKLWPVVAAEDRVIWVRGLRPRQVLLHEHQAFQKVTFECTEQGND
jgi:tRNA(Ile)-lysidine synthase